MFQQLRTSVVVLAVMTFLLGGVYPLMVTLISQVAFPYQANGSILKSKDKAIGSELIGQSFSRPEYFWGRLSATRPLPYNAASSSGSNFGPLHTDIVKNAESRLADLKRYNPSLQSIPIDLVTASASGLDPHISLAAADVQVRRVATERQIPENEVRDLIRRHTFGRLVGVLGEPRVNVLQLNLALDQAARP